MLTITINNFLTQGIEGYKPEFIQFPGGERHVKISENVLRDIQVSYKVKINAVINNSNDLIDLLLLNDALRHNGAKNIHLNMPYIPYAQQDRYAGLGTSFSLRVFANMINSAYFDSVTVLEPHSDVAPALIDNCEIIYFDEYVREFINVCANQLGIQSGELTLIAPDGGAVKRTDRLYSFLSANKCEFLNPNGYAIASKTRDLNSGQLKFLAISGDIENKHLLVVDDNCIGGYTFINLAEGIKSKNVPFKSLNLFTAHGIYSNGLDSLFSQYHKIGCTNSWIGENQDKYNDRLYIKKVIL